MDIPVNVLHGVVYHLMRVVSGESIVREKEIGIERRSCLNVLADFALDHFLFAVLDHAGADLAAALKDSHHGGFILAASPGNFQGAFGFVHIPRFATYESLIRFHMTGKHILE